MTVPRFMASIVGGQWCPVDGTQGEQGSEESEDFSGGILPE